MEGGEKNDGPAADPDLIRLRRPSPACWPSMDAYAVLGVAPDATFELIKSRYYALALQYHPDKQSRSLPTSASPPPSATSNEDAFKRVQQAWEQLKDDDKRKQYDLMQKGPSCFLFLLLLIFLFLPPQWRRPSARSPCPTRSISATCARKRGNSPHPAVVASASSSPRPSSNAAPPSSAARSPLTVLGRRALLPLLTPRAGLLARDPRALRGGR